MRPSLFHRSVLPRKAGAAETGENAQQETASKVNTIKIYGDTTTRRTKWHGTPPLILHGKKGEEEGEGLVHARTPVEISRTPDKRPSPPTRTRMDVPRLAHRVPRIAYRAQPFPLRLR